MQACESCVMAAEERSRYNHMLGREVTKRCLKSQAILVKVVGFLLFLVAFLQ
jgi:hypothetical protein